MTRIPTHGGVICNVISVFPRFRAPISKEKNYFLPKYNKIFSAAARNMTYNRFSWS